MPMLGRIGASFSQCSRSWGIRLPQGDVEIGPARHNGLSIFRHAAIQIRAGIVVFKGMASKLQAPRHRPQPTQWLGSTDISGWPH